MRRKYSYDNATGLADLKDTQNHSDAWFTLDGRCLSGKPQMRGIYINGGQKVIIKYVST